MAFIPTISACIKKNCSTLVVSDTTGVYDAATNATGWEDASTLLAADVTTLTVAVTQSGSTLSTTNVLSQLPDPVTESFTFNDITVSIIDGEYTVTYTVSDGTTTYTAELTQFHACAVRCCIDKMWIKVAEYVASTSASGCSCAEYEQKAIHMEGLYYAMLNAAAAGDTTTRDNILTKLQRLCEMEDCKCNN